MKKEIKQEEWRSIPGFPDYDVSDFGRVRSYLAREKGNGNNGWYRADNPQRILRPSMGRYLGVGLRNSSGEYSFIHIHRLVMLAFVGVPQNGQEVCHNNNDSYDNRLTNLRYDSHENNISDGESILRSLSAEEVIELREMYASGMTATEIKTRFNLSRSAIYSICAGRTYKDVGGPLVEKGIGSSLNSEDFSTIRKRRYDGEKLITIAKDYGVTDTYICKICKGVRGNT